MFCLLSALPAAASTFTVGIGAGCTHADLPSALAAAASHAGGDEIRLLANTNHQGQIIIFTDGLVLRGGYADCLASTPTGLSTLRGDSSNRTVFLAASGFTILENLNITAGNVTGNGGGIFIQGSAPVLLQHVLVFGNTATAKGGNVYVNGSPGLQVQVAAGSLISAGSALDGGGLACVGAANVQIEFDTIVANNIASGDGGGLHLSSLCNVISRAGGTAGSIANNSAGSDGGAAYVESGAEFVTGLDVFQSDGLADIENNTAGARGGGVYVTGTGSRLTSLFTHFQNNHANSAGGAVFADNGATVTIHRTAIQDFCFDSVRCSLITNNSAPVGGALYSDVLAQVTIEGTHLEGNSASTAHSVASVRGSSRLTILSSVIAKNNGPNPFLVNDAGSVLVLGNVTVAGNLNLGSGFILFGPGANGTSRVMTSAFDQAGVLFAPGAPAGVAPQVDCVMSRQAAFLTGFPPATGTRALAVADPQLAHIAAGNYMLRGTSTAIDFCDTNQWPVGLFDIRLNPRDIDHPDHPNPLGGFRDLGAEEYLDVFSDGFESGDTAAWDAMVN